MVSKSKITRLSRRSFIAASGATLALAGRKPALAQKKPLVFLTWGGQFGKGVRYAFSDPFTKATGIEVQDVTPFNYGRFTTAMQNKNPEGFDLIWFADEVEPSRAGAEGMLEPLNFEWLPDADKAVASARQPFAVAPYVTIYQVGYRTDAWPTPPSSWRDFWDVQKFPGARSLGNWVGGILEAALMADGVEPANLYPLDEDRAFRKLNEIKPHIRVFHNTSASQPVRQALYQGELAMVLTWSTDFVAAHKAGRPVNVIWNQGFYFSPSVGIAKGSPYVREAHRYLAQFFEPDALLRFLELYATTPARPDLVARMTEDQRALSASGNLDKMVNLKREYYLANLTRLQQKYDSWRVL